MREGRREGWWEEGGGEKGKRKKEKKRKREDGLSGTTPSITPIDWLRPARGDARWSKDLVVTVWTNRWCVLNKTRHCVVSAGCQ